MKTTNQDMEELYSYLAKNNISFSVNNNPSPEKIQRVEKAIKNNIGK